MKILSLLCLIAFTIFVGRDAYFVWFNPDKFVEMIIKRRDKSFPTMRLEPLLFDNNALIKWDRVLLPIIFILLFFGLVLILMEIATTGL